MTPSASVAPVTFHGLGIATNILQSLTRCNFTTPTPIQHKCIPIGIEGKDLIGIAQTGTGKTIAFGIPMIQRLARNKGFGLVLLPTRELALQVEEVLQKIGGHIGLKTAVLIGGEPIGKQKRALSRKPHIIVATPGRLIDHLERSSVCLGQFTMLVLDEADRMLDMGFAPQINKILLRMPRDRQTMLFSATIPSEIVQIATHHMKLPVRVEVAPSGTTAEDVEQEIMIVHRESKKILLETLLKKYSGTILLFCRTKHGAKKVCRSLQDAGYSVAEIHSNRSLGQRREALEGFKKGKYRILAATDIAARGIDVQNIEVVINYDLPDKLEDYVHRIGRTGRAGKEGRAISFVTPEEQQEIRKLERLIRKTIRVIRPEGLPKPSRDQASFVPSRRSAPRRGFEGGFKHFRPRRSDGSRRSSGGRTARANRRQRG